MIGFKAYWDAASQAAIGQLESRLDDHIDELMDRLCNAFGEEGVQYIKPQVRGNGRWQRSTGKTEKGIDYSVSRRGKTWTVNYLGNNMSADGRHNVAHMIDVGNVSPSQALYAQQFGLKAFPIAGRSGEVNTYLSVIHGMGHTSPEYPKKFSEKGVDHLYKNVDKIAQSHLDWFVRTWI